MDEMRIRELIGSDVLDRLAQVTRDHGVMINLVITPYDPEDVNSEKEGEDT